MNNPAIMMTTGLEKPDRASVGERMPPTSRAMSAQSATMSERTLFKANSKAVMAKTMSVNSI